jgi:hypothetical protein
MYLGSKVGPYNISSGGHTMNTIYLPNLSEKVSKIALQEILDLLDESQLEDAKQILDDNDIEWE